MTPIQTTLLLVTPVMLLLASAIVVFVVRYQKRLVAHHAYLQQLQETKQRQLLEAAIEAQEMERRRVAQDLHDEVGGMLALAKLQLTQLQYTTAGSTTADNIKDMLNEVLGSVRRISHDLMPVVLEKMGLWHALEAMQRGIPENATLQMDLSIQNKETRLQPKQELLLYRIIQELFSNTIKHAAASRISITITCEGGKLIMVYTDNGLGFDFSGPVSGKEMPMGIGLRNLHSRVALLSGELLIHSGPGAGTRAEVSVPGF